MSEPRVGVRPPHACFDRNPTRLRAYVAAAEAVQLTISSKLLRAAEIVTTGKP